MSNFNRQSQARDRAEEVQQLMHDPDAWEIRVWNSRGWHFQLSAKNISLYESDGFWALVSDDLTTHTLNWLLGRWSTRTQMRLLRLRCKQQSITHFI